MSEIKTSIDDQHDLTVHTVSGDLTSQEILERLEYGFESRPTKLILWDLTQGTWSRIGGDELKGILGRARKYSGNGSRMALVFSKEVDFGIGRMFETYADLEGCGSEFGSFRCREEADRWLGVGN